MQAYIPADIVRLIPYAAPTAFSAGLAVAAFLNCGRRRDVLAFVGIVAIEAVLSVAFIFEVFAASIEWKLFWDALRWPLAIAAEVMYLRFARSYVRPTDDRSSPTLTTLLLLPVAIAAVASVLAIAGIPEPLYARIGRMVLPFSSLAAEPSALGYGIILYGYALSAAACVVLVRHATTKGAGRGAGAVVLLAGFGVQFVAALLAVAWRMPAGSVWSSPLWTTLRDALFAYGLFGERVVGSLTKARRAVMDTLLDPVFVLGKDEVVVDCNAAARTLLGAAAGDPMGASARRLFAGWPSSVVAALDFPEAETELDLPDRDGAPSRSYRITVASNSARDRSGAWKLLVFNDITGQKTGEITLRESERRYSVLVQQSPVGVFETDTKGRLTFANERMLRLTGKPLSQLLGADWVTSIHPDDRADFVRGWHTALAARREFSAEMRLGSPRDTLLWVSALIRPMRDAASRIIGYLGALSDISERKKAESMREDVEKVIRHDLKSPLSAMGNAAELLEMLGPLNAEQTHVLAELRALATRMHGLISLSLDLRAMESGQYALEPAPLDLVAALEALRSELRPLIGGKELSLRLEREGGGPGDGLTGGPVMVLGERRLVDTVFVNLLKNAAEASPEGGEILVRLRVEKDCAVATLHNKGAVPLDVRERFFEKYATSGKIHGTGLGTYSARLMVRALNGSIELDTSEPEATTVVVRLPVPGADQETPAA